MTVEELAAELRALPRDQAVQLLRVLLERDHVERQPRETWLALADEILERYRGAWERLAQR